jgi:hypothetical protein
MKLNHDLKAFLVRLKEKVPAEKREEFARNIRTHLEAIEIDDLAGYIIAGALAGAILDVLPLGYITGVDDWVEVGAAVGGLVGYLRTSQQRRMRRELQEIIERELRHALA